MTLWKNIILYKHPLPFGIFGILTPLPSATEFPLMIHGEVMDIFLKDFFFICYGSPLYLV